MSPTFKENANFKMETKRNLDCKLKSKEETFKEILEEKDLKIQEIESTIEFMNKKISDLTNENFVLEEMINRYKLKMDQIGEEFFNINDLSSTELI